MAKKNFNTLSINAKTLNGIDLSKTVSLLDVKNFPNDAKGVWIRFAEINNAMYSGIFTLDYGWKQGVCHPICFFVEGPVDWSPITPNIVSLMNNRFFSKIRLIYDPAKSQRGAGYLEIYFNEGVSEEAFFMRGCNLRNVILITPTITEEIESYYASVETDIIPLASSTQINLLQDRISNLEEKIKNIDMNTQLTDNQQIGGGGKAKIAYKFCQYEDSQERRVA